MKTILFFFVLLLTVNTSYSQVWKSKIDSELSQKLNSNGSHAVLIVLEQADLSVVNPDWEKRKKGRFVFDLLSENALSTQANTISTLKANNTLFTSYYLVNMIATNADQDLVAKIAADRHVKSILLDKEITMVKPAHIETAVQQRSVEPEWGLKMIQADSVWRLGYQGQGVVIGGQDTGYDWDVSPLKKKYRGWQQGSVDHNYNWHDAISEISPLHGDTINDPSLNPCGFKSQEPCDDNSHGTHTMGTMVGQDTANIIGVAPEAKWIGCRNMERGWGKPSTYIECLQWFLAPTDLNDENPSPDMAPHVINNSWECPEDEGCNPSNFAVMERAVDALRAAGVFVTVSAGNSGSACNTIQNPAPIFEGSFTVGATTPEDSIAGFSSRGMIAVDSSFRMKPNVSAPGQGVRSVIRGGNFASFSGTSMAGPHVAGTVALIISANPELAGKVDILEDILERTSIAKYSTQECDGFSGAEIPNPTFGYGRINALAAVQEALKYTTDVKDIITDGGLTIYPNPTDQLFTIDSPEQINVIQLYDIQGALVREIRGMQTKIAQINVSALLPNVYIYKIKTEGNVYSGKIMIQ